MTPEITTVTSLEQARILRLPKDKLVIGLSSIICDKICLLEISGGVEGRWLSQYYSAVDWLLDTQDHPELFTNSNFYNTSVLRVLNYLKFLGIAEDKLTAQAIVAAEENLTQGHIGQMEADLSKGLPALLPESEESKRLDAEKEEKHREQSRKILLHLDSIIASRTKMYTLEEFMKNTNKILHELIKAKLRIVS